MQHRFGRLASAKRSGGPLATPCSIEAAARSTIRLASHRLDGRGISRAGTRLLLLMFTESMTTQAVRAEVSKPPFGLSQPFDTSGRTECGDCHAFRKSE